MQYLYGSGNASEPLLITTCTRDSTQAHRYLMSVTRRPFEYKEKNGAVICLIAKDGTRTFCTLSKS